MDDQDAAAPVISKSRLETLIDGVFAIAMTILVLDLKIPELTNRVSTAELARELARQTPTFLSYFLSFVVLGGFWYRHNQQYRHYRAISAGMLVLHLVQLAAAASVPFCAALLGRYGSNPLAMVVYLACLLVYVSASYATWIVAKRSRLMNPDLTERAYRRSHWRAFAVCGIAGAMLLVYGVRLAETPATPAGSLHAADDRAIRDLAARWQQAMLARDADGQASMFADDGVSYHDGQEPLVGPEAIRAWESKSTTNHPKAIITSTTDRIQIAAAGDMAVQTGEGRLTNLGQNGEDQKVHRQRFVTVWKKVNGEWKVAHDIAVNITPWE